MDDSRFFRQALEIRLWATLIVQVARRDLEKRLRFEDQKLSLPGFAILRILWSKPATINDLSEIMLITPATLVTLVDTLEKKEFVKRGKDSADRRKSPVAITAKGKQVVETIPVSTDGDLLTQGLMRLSEEKRQALEPILRELLQHMIGDGRLHRIEEVEHGYFD